jgi:inorganic triphosphatase YgiF
MERDLVRADPRDVVRPEDAPASREIELKLEIEPQAATTLLDHPLLRNALGAPAQNDSIYYDTRKGMLRTAGISLRVRRIGDRFVQTLKSGARAAGGLFDRREWEEPIAGSEPEFERLRRFEPVLDQAMVRSILKPVYETRIRRRACTLDRDGARIELVVDEGEVVAGKRRQALAEIELELVEGPPTALFALARELQTHIPLKLGMMTKSERGARLASGKAWRASKAEPVKLTPEMNAADGFRTIALACLRHFSANEPLVISARDVDALHQSRVALRRLRSAFSLFKPILGGAELGRFRDDVRTLAATLGAARNLDVLLARRSEELPKDVRRKLVEERRRAYDVAIAALTSPEVRAMMLDLSEWIALTGADERGNEPLPKFADAVLNRFWRKVRRKGKLLHKLDDEERHELRIAGKKLRYAGEFFAGLYADDDRVAVRDAFLTAIEGLQEHLGGLNDLVTERELERDLARIGIDLPKRDRRESNQMRSHLVSASEQAFKELAEVGRFWRRE